eukprot:gene9541-9705_t
MFPSASGTVDGKDVNIAAAEAQPLAAVPVGPKPIPFLGNKLCYASGTVGLPFYNIWENVFTPEKMAIWGDTVQMYLPGAAAPGPELLKDAVPRMVEHSVLTCDPEVVAELLKRQDVFVKVWGRRKLEKRLQDFAGNGLFTSSTYDPDWETAHGLLPRGFNQIRIKNYFGVILEKTRSFAAAWFSKPPGYELTDVNDWLTCMTADAVVKASMGLDMANVECKATGAPLHKFVEAFRYGLKAAIGGATVKGEFGTLASWNPFFDGQAALAAKAEAAFKQSNEVVQEMLEKTRRGEIGGNNSVLTAMLNDISPSTGGHVRLINIYGQVMNLMIAGHETTAATLSWTLYYIATNPEVEAKALAELQAVLGDEIEPKVDDVPKLVYIEACFREALRLHPAVGTVQRDVTCDTTLKGKWFLQKGQRVEINNVALQRREDQWGGQFGDPCKYNPERFMPGAAEASGRHPNAFNPWGFGVRACIGQQFALWEAKVFLAMILRMFKLRVPDGYIPKPSAADGGAAPTPHHFRLKIWRRAGIDPSCLLKASKPQASVTSTARADGDGSSESAAALASTEGMHNTPLWVLYGSNSGTCEELAGVVAGKATAAGFAPKTASLDSVLKAGAAPLSGAVIIVTSTYNGTPPDNAAEFAKWLPVQAPGSLSQVVYGVFGVGNSQWQQTYQAFPKRLALQMEAAGAKQVTDISCTDVDTTDWMDVFDEWQSVVIKGLLIHLQLTPPKSYSDTTGGTAGSAQPRLILKLLKPGEFGMPLTSVEVIHKLEQLRQAKPDLAGPDYNMLQVLENRELQKGKSSRSTRHVQLALPAGSKGEYSSGDHLEIMGTNDAALVDLALKLLGLEGPECVEWVTNVDDSSGSARGLGGVSKLTINVTVKTALAWLVDLAALPSKRIIAALAESCPCPPEAQKLKQMATEEGYKEKVIAQRLTVVELLLQFRSVPIDLQQLANLLPRLAPRYYSISSSPLARPGTCSISVGLVNFVTPTGRHHKGAASAHIAATPVGGQLVGCVRQLSSSFRLPSNPMVPVIMIGPGTGVAPMMGFLQERAALAAQGAALGPAHLFFGCRSSQEDFIYQPELEGYVDTGVLSGLHTAFSREGPIKVYVQDLILQQGKVLWQLLEEGAYVYVCGDARKMAPDVRAAFREVARSWGGKNTLAADSWLGSLLENKRYLEDVWAG